MRRAEAKGSGRKPRRLGTRRYGDTRAPVHAAGGFGVVAGRRRRSPSRERANGDATNHRHGSIPGSFRRDVVVGSTRATRPRRWGERAARRLGARVHTLVSRRHGGRWRRARPSRVVRPRRGRGECWESVTARAGPGRPVVRDRAEAGTERRRIAICEMFFLCSRQMWGRARRRPPHVVRRSARRAAAGRAAFTASSRSGTVQPFRRGLAGGAGAAATASSRARRAVPRRVPTAASTGSHTLPPTRRPKVTSRSVLSAM